MHYLTIVLNLIQSRPVLHEQLRRQRQLLATVEQCAAELKILHQAWMTELHRNQAGSLPAQIRAEALELALADLQLTGPDLPAAWDELLATDFMPPE